MRRSIVHILVVDDHDVRLRALQRALSKSGYEVSSLSNGIDVPDAIDHNPPNLMLLNFDLSDMSVLEVCTQVRAQSQMPIIVYFGDKTEYDKRLVLDRGVNYYLSKPFNMYEILEYVELALRGEATPASVLPVLSTSSEVSQTRVEPVVSLNRDETHRISLDRDNPRTSTPSPKLLFFTRFIAIIAIIHILLLTPFALLFMPHIAAWNADNCPILSNRNIVVNGSTVLAPLIKDIVKEHQTRCTALNVSVNPDPKKFPQGSLNALQQVAQGNIDIATSDVFANLDPDSHIQDYQVAIAVFALVVHNDVDITKLTTQQIKQIYSGAISNWHDVGSNTEQDIVLVSPPPTSSLRWIFDTHVLGTPETISDPQSQMYDTTDKVIQAIESTPGAIGYVPLYEAQKNNLKILSIDDNSPQDATAVKSGHYAFWTIEHMYTRGVPGSPVIELITNMYSRAARPVIQQDGYLNINDFSNQLLVDHISQE